MLYKTIERFYDKPFFSDLISPLAYEDSVYPLFDGSLGMIWEIEGINIDGKGPEDIQKASNTFANFLKSLPTDIPLQIIVATWRGLPQSSLDIYREGDLSNPYVDEYMRRKQEWHEHGKLNGFAHEGTNHFYPRTIKVYFTVKQNPPQSNRGLLSWLLSWFQSSTDNLHNAASMKETRNKLKKIEMVIDTSLSSGGIANRRVTPDSLISLMYRLLNPGRSLTVPPPVYTGGDLRKYMMFNSPEADQHGWRFEDNKYSVISFDNNPATPGDDGNLQTFPNILFREINGVSLIDLSPMMLFTMNFHFPSQDAIKRKLNVKRSLAFLHRSNILGDTSIDKEIAREESRELLRQMYDGEKIARASYHLCIPSSLEESEFTCQQIVSYLNISTGSNAFREDLIAPGIFMRCLPFGFDQDTPDEERFVRRAVLATSAVLADVAPIYMSGKGVCTERASGSYNRRGEDVWFDPYNRDTAITSPHFLLTGATGTGKTVRLIDMASQFMRRHPTTADGAPFTIFILEKGESCRNFVELAGGQYLKFEGEPDFILDPLAGDFGDDHRAFLTSLIVNMIADGTDKKSKEEVAVLSEVVLSLQTMAQSSRNLQELANTLKSYGDPISVSAGRKLFPFYGSGQYARFLEGDKPRFGFKSNLFGADLADLDMYPDLQAVVIFLLIFYITEKVKNTPGEKLLIVDEAWGLFKNEAAVGFLVSATKTFRKHGCAVGFGTQQLDDFAVIARAMNMRDNCPNKILLYQEMDVVSRNAEALELNKATLDLYKTIKKAKGYSEALIVTQNWTSVSRLTLDPVSYWIATSSPADRDYLKDLRGRELSLREAIHLAAKEHPYGIHSTSAVPQK